MTGRDGEYTSVRGFVFSRRVTILSFYSQDTSGVGAFRHLTRNAIDGVSVQAEDISVFLLARGTHVKR